MANINLFSIKDKVLELPATSVSIEKEIQTLIENNMQTFFGVTFLKTEFLFPGGRIDSLGIDENNCPVIFEYKRSMNENVINQGLFYLDWLLDHKADFKLLVMDILGIEKAAAIDWSVPCVFCIANDFTKYDEHAVNQMQRNIKLVRYKKFGGDLVLFEHLNAPNVKPIAEITETVKPRSKGSTADKTFQEQLDSATPEIKALFDEIRSYILSLGDDITENQLKLYLAFKKTKNIICIVIIQSRLYLYIKLNPDEIVPIDHITRNVKETGHWGTGDLEATVRSKEDFEKIKPLFDKAYNEN